MMTFSSSAETAQNQSFKQF